jgi:hypothetical protein
MWGFYVWPRIDLCERGRALVEGARDLVEPVRRIGGWVVWRIDAARSVWPPSM